MRAEEDEQMENHVENRHTKKEKKFRDVDCQVHSFLFHFEFQIAFADVYIE